MIWRLFLHLLGLLSTVIAYSTLSDDSLRAIPDPGNDFDIHDGAILASILIPRVPGTPGSTKVQQHLVQFFQKQLPDWTLTYQNSTSTTPTSQGKQVPFVNIIATRDPPWASEGSVGRLALVAHYDSKLTPKGFIGATDSAAPCAMIMHAARSIDEALTNKWSQMEAEGSGSDDLEGHKGVQIILLDGEEAFASWTDEDSLYGARSLAEQWETDFHPATSMYQTPLDSIDLFVLLDLLGADGGTVPSYFKTTHWAYRHMAQSERRLRQLGLLNTKSNVVFFSENEKKEDDRWLGGFIGDDHVPFLQRGVEILHLIAYPFPTVWHTINDDGEHLDLDTVKDWAKIVTAFTAEWLELDKWMTAPLQAAREAKHNSRRVAFGLDDKDEL